jgi:hypothetical protein
MGRVQLPVSGGRQPQKSDMGIIYQEQLRRAAVGWRIVRQILMLP